MPDPWRDRLVDGLASRRTNVTVAVSEALRELLVRRRIAPANRIEVIRNGVDTELHAPHADTGAVRRELGIDPSTPIIGSIGRLEPIKGYDVAVRAFASLLRRWQGLKPALILAGEGSERAAVEALISELGIGDAVHVLGWRNDVVDLLSCYDLFTMSSRSEGTSVSLLESMSSGLCPVVTAVGGNSAVLGPELAHRLVPSEDPEGLARAWEDALLDADKRRRDSDAARRRVQDRFSLDTMVDAYQSLYLRAATRGTALPSRVPSRSRLTPDAATSTLSVAREESLPVARMTVR
jgi:glycosyltransferase involved in cell wall biosynthesis